MPARTESHHLTDAWGTRRGNAARFGCCPSHPSQRGAVLLMFAVMLVLGVTTLLVSGLYQAGLQRNTATRNPSLLGEARSALIGYAMTFADYNPGQLSGLLPCPDMDGDGLEDRPCGVDGESAIGHLPWQTLGLSVPRDGSGACLWYAVAGPYKANPNAVVSSESNGLFQIVDQTDSVRIGATQETQALAVVIAPGAPVLNQNRSVRANFATTCGSRIAADGANQPHNYLETRNGVDNARGTHAGAAPGAAGSEALPTLLPSVFVYSGRFPQAGELTFNDGLAWITPADFAPVYRLVEQSVAQRLRACLNSYGAGNGGHYPWAAPLNGTAAPTYSDASGERFGRIAQDLTRTGNDGLTPAWPIDPLDATQTCFGWGWWSAWREQVFYAVAKDSVPLATAGGDLQLDGINSPFVLLLGGRRLAGQDRSDDPGRGRIENYLEADNVPASGDGKIPPGDEHFQSSAGVNFNDFACSATACFR